MALAGVSLLCAAYVAPATPRVTVGGTGARMAAGGSDVAKRAALAAEWIANEGFYSPVKRELMSEDFVFMGPIVGPLNAQDYLGTLVSGSGPRTRDSAHPYTDKLFRAPSWTGRLQDLRRVPGLGAQRCAFHAGPWRS